MFNLTLEQLYGEVRFGKWCARCSFWPMVSSHDFRVLPYVEESDWSACTTDSALIGPVSCVVRCHWLVITGLREWALLVAQIACQCLISRLLFQEHFREPHSQDETCLGCRSCASAVNFW